MRIRRISLFILLCCLCWNVFAAEYQIKGVVIDKSTRQPLEFVNVLVVGLGIGALPMPTEIFSSLRCHRVFTGCKLLSLGIKQN